MTLSRRRWLVLALVALACRLRGSGPAVEVSTTAPEFALPDPDGAIVSLAELRARGPVVVVFYRGYW